MAVWLKDRGIVNGYVDVDMMFAKSVDAGATWTAPVALFQSGPNDTVGQFLFKGKDSELFLVWSATNMQVPRVAHTCHAHSFDGGQTWLSPTTFPDEWQASPLRRILVPESPCTGTARLPSSTRSRAPLRRRR